MLDLVAWFGISAQIVSDNGLQFTSMEFRNFCNIFKINHIFSSPYHPRTNGKAKRFVRMVKNVMGKKKISYNRLMYWINWFFLAYKNAPHATTGFALSEMLLGCRCKMKFR